MYKLTIHVLHHRLHRQPKHLLAFLLAELGTRYFLIYCGQHQRKDLFAHCYESLIFLLFSIYSGSIDGNNQLVIKGRFQQKQIENVLRRYISKWKSNHYKLFFQNKL